MKVNKNTIGLFSINTKTVSVIVTPTNNCDFFNGQIIDTQLITELIYPSKKLIRVGDKHIEACKLVENKHQIWIDNKKHLVLNVFEI